MSLFQKSVLNNYLNTINDDEINSGWEKIQDYQKMSSKVRDFKEEVFQAGFLTKIFVECLGYKSQYDSADEGNLFFEEKNISDSKKADGAIKKENEVILVIELKGTNTKNLKFVEAQAFGYKAHHPKCEYVVTSNFEKLRFYVENAVDYEEFDLFNLSKEDYKLLHLCLHKDSIFNGIPKKLKNESVLVEESITKKLYKDYSAFRNEIFNSLVETNSEYEKLILFNKTQKLLDRFLFIFFAEDRNLVPANSISKIISKWEGDLAFGESRSLYSIFKQYFSVLNIGRPAKGEHESIFAYNGGLFSEDEVLDKIEVDDNILLKHTKNLSRYDFESDVSVNILGHIFEHSLSEIEEIQNEIIGVETNKTLTKRKKDGVFYTPSYITKYIIENTLGKLCLEKKAELEINEEVYTQHKARSQKRIDNLNAYREWLLQLTICDPACGSGAFLVQALDFLIDENKYIDELNAAYHGASIPFSDITSSILENNLYGVDINGESVDIAKLSLWLRTAQKGRKLTSLNSNLKCGNSLIDDPKVVGDRAFNWEKEFPEVFNDGGFDVIIGNPPYVPIESLVEKEVVFIKKNYQELTRKFDTSVVFKLKCLDIIKDNGVLSFISTITWQTGKNYEKFREYIFENFNLEEIINLPFNVFSDAYVDTGILIIRKNKFNKEYRILNFPKKLKIQSLDSLNFKIIDDKMYDSIDWKIVLNPVAQKILKRNLNSSNYKLLGEISISTQGLSPSRFQLNENEFENSYPYLEKGQVKQYIFIKNKISFTGMNDKLNLIKFYNDRPKILIRRLINRQDRLTVGYNEEKCVFKKDINPFIITNSEIDTKYVLGIMASKLISYLYVNTSSIATKDDFRQTTLSELRELPIILTDSNIKSKIINMSDQLLHYTKEYYNSVTNFYKYFISVNKISNPSKKLENWPELNFYDFINNLNEAIHFSVGVNLLKKDEMEWMKLFEEKKNEVNQLSVHIKIDEKKIDELVYKLYGLTNEEIEIVENN
tara:strand:+ start:54 stop:3047 length:2994 start_codon:yes stop_codon:yes gene_type:complete